MAVWSPVKWVPWVPWLGLGYASWVSFSPAFEGPYQVLVGMAYFVLYLLASFWQGQVTKIVPEPYLDEIFHIPQAQAYCSGDFHIWDPKLTTPPGLYAFATLFGNLGGIRSCSVYSLRLFNTLILIATMTYATDCRSLISRTGERSMSKDDRRRPGSLSVSPNSLHTALNIALFPPLFFFAGLFYTDVLSTCLVLGMYRLFLQQKGSGWLYLGGILALTLRQTNIFWVAVFMGGLEVVRSIKNVEKVSVPQVSTPTTMKKAAMTALNQYCQGELHDIPLKEAEVQDFVLCTISIAIATIYHPIVITKKLWPYLALLISFATFVFWNGGVVLGDKSNHVATLHFPQLLYLFPFIAFFSAPLLIPSIVSTCRRFISLLIPSLALNSRRSTGTPTPKYKTLISLLYATGALGGILLVIRYNTIIHPFTLADNRHYIFYVFRYSILFHPLVRYLLGPIYMLCFYFVYRTLSSYPASPPSFDRPSFLAGGNRTELQQRIWDKAHERRVVGMRRIDEGPTTSFFLIWFGTTALCLITAPLVEPRYFIVPWVVWRLHVPGWSLSQPSPQSGGKEKKRGVVDMVKFWGWKGHDYRLWIETAWFLTINFITGYIFLYRGFSWPQEPGKVQRFMW